MATRRLSVISLYTGAGGLDFGFEAAGFRTAVAVELDPVACRTIRRNRPEWSLIERDIHEVSSKEILRAGQAQGRAGRCADRRASVPAVLEVLVLGGG